MNRQEIIDRGIEGEEKFNKWLKESGISYLHVNQSPQYCATLFPKRIKRPDFLVLIDSIGFLAVDVKNRAFSEEYGTYTLDSKREIEPTIAFERLLRIPVWYAFLEQNGDTMSWAWISALKSKEVAKKRATKKNDPFLAIKREHFIQIDTPSDLGKLYTQNSLETRGGRGGANDA